MDFMPYKVNEYLENTFYQVPKELFINPYYKKLNSDSKLWGVYKNVEVQISSKNAKETEDYGGTWSEINDKKPEDKSMMLTTGASDNIAKMNIYDFAGNEWEWTLEHATSSTVNPCVDRGGACDYSCSEYPASYRDYNETSDSDCDFSFRSSLY